MHRQRADPLPAFSPTLSAQQLSFPFIQGLSLEDSRDRAPEVQEGNKAFDDVRTVYSRSYKTKGIQKGFQFRKSIQRQKSMKTKETNKKKIGELLKKIDQLQSQNDILNRKLQCCPHCNAKVSDQAAIKQTQNLHCDQEMMKRAGDIDFAGKRGSHGSIEFQNVEFHTPSISREFDERAWVFLGTAMIAMGSKCLQVDGTMNVFRVLKETVDELRRQVQKSQQNIKMDFYLSKQQMQEDQFMNEVGFDPFISKPECQGLSLEGVRVESVSQFELTYDSKLTFGLKYEALLGAMEYIHENSWIIG